MTTKQLNLWKSGAVQITGRAEQVHEWRALPPLRLPQLSFSVCFVFLLCNAKSTFLCCCVWGEVEDQDRAGYQNQLEGITPFLCPICNFLFCVFLSFCCCCCYCCYCVLGGRAGCQLERIAPFRSPSTTFFFVSILSFGFCCYCVSGEVAEQRASWRALPSSCVPLQLSFSQPQPADQLWIYMLWHKLQRFPIFYKSFGLTSLSLMSQGRVQF